jgi:putative flippase GtrA
MTGIHSEFLRFCMAGTVGFIVDAGVLQMLAGMLDMDPYGSRIISFLAAATVTWLLNRRYTFNADRDARLHREWARYVSINAFGGGLNYLTYALCVSQFPLVHRYLFLGVAVGSAVGLLVNYSASKYLVFGLAASK